MKRFEDKEKYFKGCLIGGAIGDALGYPVEFYSYNQIKSMYGDRGIREYTLSPNGKALFSDDTQMTLFTANGILLENTFAKVKQTTEIPHRYVYHAYLDWLVTQGLPPVVRRLPVTWLSGIRELFSRRAPGRTCIMGLLSKASRSVDNPLNDSKGCGGVMRIAPYGLFYGEMEKMDPAWFLKEAAEIGAITHGHSMSHLSCALTASILGQIIYGSAVEKDLYRDRLEEVVRDALIELRYVDYLAEKEAFVSLIEKALSLCANDLPDEENIRTLGGGWVAEETVAISVYCACKYQNDPIEGIIAAVNHSGDSDSTGAVAGNILGAWKGMGTFPKAFVEDLELERVIEEIATDLAAGCPPEGSAAYDEWSKKYSIKII